MRGRGSSPKYLSYIRSLPCLICARRGLMQTSRTEAHHYGPHGYGRKAPDDVAIPLCRGHHQDFGDAVHRLGKRFAEHHGLDMESEIERLRSGFAGKLEAA